MNENACHVRDHILLPDVNKRLAISTHTSDGTLATFLQPAN